jgi:hypothetical protein
MSKLIFGQGTQLTALPQGEDVQTTVKLEKLSDVDLTPDTLGASQDGHILQFSNSAGKFVNVAPSAVQITEVDGGTY